MGPEEPNLLVLKLRKEPSFWLPRGPNKARDNLKMIIILFYTLGLKWYLTYDAKALFSD